MTDAALFVKVPLVVARLAPEPGQSAGGYAYLYAGTELPENLAEGEADRLLAEGFVAAAAEPDVPEEAVADGLDDLGLAELRALAAERGIDLAGAKKADDVRAKIRAAA